MRNVSNVWMAATMGCCQCHDHKFDPFSTKDFYSMAAFFADVQEAAVGRREPGMAILNASQESNPAEPASQEKSLDQDAEYAQTPELAMHKLEMGAHTFNPRRRQTWRLLTPIEAPTIRIGNELRIESDGLDSRIEILRERHLCDPRELTSSARDHGHSARGDYRCFASRQRPHAALNGNFVLTGRASKRMGRQLKLRKAFADHSQDESAVAGTAGSQALPGAILPQIGKDHVAIFEPSEPFTDIGISTGADDSAGVQPQFAQHEIGHFRMSATSDADPGRFFDGCRRTFGAIVRIRSRVIACQKDLTGR